MMWTANYHPVSSASALVGHEQGKVVIVHCLIVSDEELLK